MGTCFGCGDGPHESKLTLLGGNGVNYNRYMYNNVMFFEFMLVHIEHQISQIIFMGHNGDELATNHEVHNKLV
jgi:hypothetical protein